MLYRHCSSIFLRICHKENPRRSDRFEIERNTSAIGEDVNFLGDDMDTKRENTETLLEAGRDVGLEMNAEKAKYMIRPRHQNRNIRIADESFENVAKFKYLRTALTNQNDIHDEIKSRLNSGNASYHSVQNILYFRLI
jgi:hypothetical protein